MITTGLNRTGKMALPMALFLLITTTTHAAQNAVDIQTVALSRSEPNIMICAFDNPRLEYRSDSLKVTQDGRRFVVAISADQDISATVHCGGTIHRLRFRPTDGQSRFLFID